VLIVQGGISEKLLVKAMCRASIGRKVFYVLPSTVLKNAFVQERFDLSIEFTPYYKHLTSGMSRKMVESTSLKHVGKGSIYFVGSHSPANFTSYASDYNIIDEWDSCDQDNLKMAPERQSASDDPETDIVGNPTVEDFGVDAEYKKSDMKQWHITCTHCNKLNQVNFFDHVVREEGEGDYIIRDPNYEKFSGTDCFPICQHCERTLERYGEGYWIERKKSEISGREHNKIFGSKVTMQFLLDRFEDGMVDQEKMQRFYNGDLGLAYTASGSKIDFNMLDDCIDDYIMPNSLPSNAVCVMGIDVGKYLHIRINQLLPDGRMRAVYIGTIPLLDGKEIKEIKEVKNLWKLYNCKCGVVDAAPEMRLARSLCSNIKGMFRWNHGSDTKNPVDIQTKKVVYDRNVMLDNVKASILSKHIILPKNARTIGGLTTKGVSEYYDNMSAPTRVLEEYGREQF